MTLSLLSRQATGPTVLNEPKAEDLAAPDVIWIDLLDPSRGEEQLVEEAFGIDAPSEAERAALEESARFYLENDVMVLHATVVARAKPDAKAETPTKLPPIAHKREIVSFFLTKTALITVRTCPLRAFEANEGRASADLAEVETDINAAKELASDGERLIFAQADRFIAESKVELEKGNYDAAVSRASQAVELTQALRIKAAMNREMAESTYAEFIRPLHLHVAKRSNIRKKPLPS